jgi:hypothetical protein
MPIVGFGLVLYGLNHLRDKSSVGDVRAGLWLVGWLALEYAASAAGSYQGHHLLHAPWDSLLVAVVSIGVYVWGVRSGIAHMAARPEQTERLRDEASAASAPPPERPEATPAAPDPA